MFEEIISMLDDLGVEYNEDFENGSLVIDIAPLDKVDIITIIKTLVDLGEQFDIDETTITVNGGVIEEIVPEEEEALDLDAMLDEAL